MSEDEQGPRERAGSREAGQRPGPAPAGDSPEAAMDAALEAEARAQEAVAECERRADAMVEETRRRARRIAERADDRITRIHTGCSEATDARVDAILARAEKEDEVTEPGTREREVLKAAITALATELTGGDAEDGGNP